VTLLLYSVRMEPVPQSSSLPKAGLKHREEFESLIANYEPSAEARSILNSVPLVLLTGPTSSGRNTLIERLVATGKFYFIISDTTRPARVNNGILEQNGREYWFRTEDEMLEELRNGEFLETEVIHGQQVSGMSIREFGKAGEQHKIGISDVDIGGISNIMHAKPNTTPIVVLPPSFQEWQRRLVGRGRMEPDELKRRMETAARIFAAAIAETEFTLIINDDLDEAVSQISQIVNNGRATPESQEQARTLAAQLRQETLDFIAKL
jgi:guanylate kinase